MDWKTDMAANIGLFDGKKRQWQPDEMQIAYRIYNNYYGSNVIDSGCGSCRRSVLAHCYKIAQRFTLEGGLNLNDNPEVGN